MADIKEDIERQVAALPPGVRRPDASEKLRVLQGRLLQFAPSDLEKERYKAAIAAATQQWQHETQRQDKMIDRQDRRGERVEDMATRRGERVEDRDIRRQERAEDRSAQGWDLLTDPKTQQQYYVQKGRPETAIGLDGQPFKPSGAERLSGAGGQTASAMQAKDVNAEIARLDNEFRASKPDATPADIAKAHTEHSLAARKKFANASSSETRSSPRNMIMRQLQAEAEASGGSLNADQLQRASNKITAFDAIERRYGGGRGANDMTALNTVADHLNLMTQYSAALRDGSVPFTQIPKLNAAIQYIATNAGRPEVTDFNIARDIMADEVVKLLTSTGGTVEDRRGMQSRLAPAMSEYQQTGSLRAVESFVAGRFKGLEQGYARNDAQRVKDFRDNLLTDEARNLFVRHQKEAPIGFPHDNVHGGGTTSAAPVQGQPAQAAPAETVPVPPGFAGDPDGTGYEKGGAMWVKRGNQLVKTPGAVKTP